MSDQRRTSKFWTDDMVQCTTKPTKCHVRQAKTLISLSIRPGWSESSLSAWRKPWSLATHWAHSKDSDQTGRMPRLIWIFAGCSCHFVSFVMRWLYYRNFPNFKGSWYIFDDYNSVQLFGHPPEKGSTLKGNICCPWEPIISFSE